MRHLISIETVVNTGGESYPSQATLAGLLDG